MADTSWRTRTIQGACGAVLLVAAFLLGASARSMRQEPSPDETYFLDLYVHVVGTVALPIWEDLIDAIQSQADSEVVDNQALYGQLRSTFPVVSLDWDGNGLSLVSAPPLLLTLGVEQYLLVEVENSSPQDVELIAFIDSVLEVPGSAPSSNTAVAPPATSRGLLTPVLVEDSSTDQLSVHVRIDSQDVTPVSVDVSLQQSARILGTLVDESAGEARPGRVQALCSDGVLRRGEAFSDVPTVSQKLIPLTPMISFLLPFFYSEVDGTFDLHLPAGEVHLTVERGYEFEVASQSVFTGPGDVLGVVLASDRVVDMESKGWYSGDTHVHWVDAGWSDDEDYEVLAAVQRAEDLRVVNNLTLRHVNASQGEFILPDDFDVGPVPEHSDASYLLH